MKCGTHQNKMNHYGCCCGPKIHRYFLTAEEKIKQLEQYKKGLEKEIEGVEKAIQQMKE